MSHQPMEWKGDARGLKFAIVTARFNGAITERLLEGARDALKRAEADRFDEFLVPGAFELPLAAKKIAQSGGYDGIIALGAVIRGDTPHFDYVAGEAARGLQQVALETGLPVAFGVLTTDTLEQAKARAGGPHGHTHGHTHGNTHGNTHSNTHSNKGYDAAMTAIEMARLLMSLGK